MTSKAAQSGTAIAAERDAANATSTNGAVGMLSPSKVGSGKLIRDFQDFSRLSLY